MNNRRAFLIGLTTLGVVLVIALLAIPFRAWIRSNLAVKVSRVAFGTGTFMRFDRDFSPVDNMFKTYDFKLTGKSLPLLNQYDTSKKYGTATGCGLEGYDGFHETVSCLKIREYKPESLQAFKEQWKKQAPSVVHFLETQGWHQEYPDQPSYIELFNGSQEDGRWLTYVKSHGVIRCSLMVAYNPPYPNFDDQVWIEERCDREVKFFGGY